MPPNSSKPPNNPPTEHCPNNQAQSQIQKYSQAPKYSSFICSEPLDQKPSPPRMRSFPPPIPEFPPPSGGWVNSRIRICHRSPPQVSPVGSVRNRWLLAHQQRSSWHCTQLPPFAVPPERRAFLHFFLMIFLSNLKIHSHTELMTFSVADQASF